MTTETDWAGAGFRFTGTPIHGTLPPAPVPLPAEGPPAMSPRARRTARLLKIPLQALPIPEVGRRITERDVLAAARMRAAAPMTPAARELAAERGSLGLELARKLDRRVTAADVANMPAVPLRCPAERVRMRPEQIERALAAARSISEIPQITATAFIPAAPLMRAAGDDPHVVAALFIRALGRILADDALKAFRAVIDGDDIVYRGQINIGCVRYGDGPEPSGNATFYNVDRMAFQELHAGIADLSSRQKVPVERGSALVTLHDMRNLPLESLQGPIEPGQTALLFLPSIQSRMVHDASMREWILHNGWPLRVCVDARVIDAALVGFFIKKLKSFMEITSILI